MDREKIESMILTFRDLAMAGVDSVQLTREPEAPYVTVTIKAGEELSTYRAGHLK